MKFSFITILWTLLLTISGSGFCSNKKEVSSILNKIKPGVSKVEVEKLLGKAKESGVFNSSYSYKNLKNIQIVWNKKNKVSEVVLELETEIAMENVIPPNMKLVDMPLYPVTDQVPVEHQLAIPGQGIIYEISISKKVRTIFKLNPWKDQKKGKSLKHYQKLWIKREKKK